MFDYSSTAAIGLLDVWIQSWYQQDGTEEMYRWSSGVSKEDSRGDRGTYKNGQSDF